MTPAIRITITPDHERRNWFVARIHIDGRLAGEVQGYGRADTRRAAEVEADRLAERKVAA